MSTTFIEQPPKPAYFKTSQFEKAYHSPYTEEQIWNWLNNPKTFTASQVWPYKVEFLPDKTQKSDFERGVLNNHHGPLLSLAGLIGEINPHYRDLHYFYGSYAISFRFFRPFRLEFWTATDANGSQLKMKLSTHVYSPFYKFWNWSQQIFWSGFGKKMNHAIKKSLK